MVQDITGTIPVSIGIVSIIVPVRKAKATGEFTGTSDSSAVCLTVSDLVAVLPRSLRFKAFIAL